MSATAAALAELDAAQEAFAPVSIELRNAREAIRRGKTKANLARFNAAGAAFDEALARCDRAHAALEAAQAIDGALEAQAIAQAEAFAQPTLF